MAFAFAGVGDDDDDAVAAARHSVGGVSCGHNVDETAAATPTIKLVDGMVGTRELRSVLQGVNMFGFGSCWCDTPQRHSHSTAVTSRLFQGSLYLRQLVVTRSRYSTTSHPPPATSYQPPASQPTSGRASQLATRFFVWRKVEPQPFARLQGSKIIHIALFRRPCPPPTRFS